MANVKPTAEIQTYLIQKVSEALEIPAEEIDVDTSLAEYGVDSITLVEFTANLEDWLELELDPELLYEKTTIREISDFLESLQSEK
jgi:acyl carrier protein